MSDHPLAAAQHGREERNPVLGLWVAPAQVSHLARRARQASLPRGLADVACWSPGCKHCAFLIRSIFCQTCVQDRVFQLDWSFRPYSGVERAQHRWQAAHPAGQHFPSRNLMISFVLVWMSGFVQPLCCACSYFIGVSIGV